MSSASSLPWCLQQMNNNKNLVPNSAWQTVSKKSRNSETSAVPVVAKSQNAFSSLSAIETGAPKKELVLSVKRPSALNLRFGYHANHSHVKSRIAAVTTRGWESRLESVFGTDISPKDRLKNASRAVANNIATQNDRDIIEIAAGRQIPTRKPFKMADFPDMPGNQTRPTSTPKWGAGSEWVVKADAKPEETSSSVAMDYDSWADEMACDEQPKNLFESQLNSAMVILEKGSKNKNNKSVRFSPTNEERIIETDFTDNGVYEDDDEVMDFTEEERRALDEALNEDLDESITAMDWLKDHPDPEEFNEAGNEAIEYFEEGSFADHVPREHTIITDFRPMQYWNHENQIVTNVVPFPEYYTPYNQPNSAFA